MAKRNKVKPKKKRSKIILFLVEGKSEKFTLETSIERIVDEICGKGIVVKFTTMAGGGDSTADSELNPKEIESEISHRIEKNSASGESEDYIYPKQVVKMVQIVDLDGAYVNKENIIQRSEPMDRGENRRYYEDRIETDNWRSTNKNLERKRTNLDYLSSIDTFKLGSNRVEYKVYFFSSNLEHFLYGIQNFGIQDNKGGKVGQAKQYSSECSNDKEYFANTMQHGENVLKGMSYRESWDYVKQRGTRSLSRCSNINLMIDDLRDWCERFVSEEDNA